MKHTIASVAIGLPLDGPFHYLIPEHLQERIQIGQRVFVPFRHAKRVGYVVGFPTRSDVDELKAIVSIIDQQPLLTPSMMALAESMSRQYGCSLGEAIDTMLPRLLRKGRGVADRPVLSNPSKKTSKKWLIVHDSPHEKWVSIIKMIQQMLDKGQTVLLIAPDLRMQEVLVEQLRVFQSSMLVMGRQTEKVELEQWQKAVNGDARIVVGTRSHVFLPLPQLGLMMIFHEEHDAMKQEQMPAYHVRDIACARADREKFHLVFSTITPSLELWHRADQQQWTKKYYVQETRPDIRLINMSNYNPEKSSIISVPLQNHIDALLAEGQSIVLVVQRLGLVAIVERRIAQLYKNARRVTYTKETKRMPKRFDVLIATPALLRESGHYQCDHIAFLDADAELNRMDYQATHFLYRTLRVLRYMTTHCLWVQTKQPTHSVMTSFDQNDIQAFYDDEIALRQDMGLPPFGTEIMLSLRAEDQEVVAQEGERLFWLLSERAPEGVDVMAPQADNIVQVHDKFRYPIGVLGRDVVELHAYIKKSVKEWKKKKGVVLSTDVRI